MYAKLPDTYLLLTACLTDCQMLAGVYDREEPRIDFARRLRELTPTCKEFDPLLLHKLLTGTNDDPRRSILHQTTEMLGWSPSAQILEKPLHSVLNRIELEETFPGDLVYAQTRWSELNDAIFPKASHEVSINGGDRLKIFFDRWLDFAQHAANLNALLAGTFSLIDEYLWCIPADAAQADVPLSGMLRLKSAATACLWHRQQATESLSDNPFRLVAGDLSGIQTYLFSITEGGKSESGTAKRLRARSLFVQLLAEVGMWKTLSVYNLPPCNMLMASGGKFLLLWPNLPEQNDPLQKLRQEADAWLLKELHGTIGLAFAAVEVAADELRNGFGNVLERIEQELFRQKHRILETELQTQEGWNEAAFLIDESFRFEVCPSCQKFPRSAPNMFCQHCQTDEEIGKIMAHRPRWLAFFATPPERGANTLPVLNMTTQVIEHERDLLRTPDLLIQLGGELDLTSAATHCPLIWRPPAPYVNRDLQFSPMAQQGEGRALLGYVKADVDHLGKIFQWGFRRDTQTSYDTPARFSALSRQLERFFGAWLSQFLKQSYSGSYTVFAGGDDLFIIGHWDTMLRCIQELQTRFRDFTGWHPHFTLSAGIALVKERYPLAHAAREAEEQVETAKRQAAIERKLAESRDQIALLGDVLSWEAFRKILQERDLILQDNPHSAFLYHLLRYAEMWREFKKGDTRGLRFQPYLAYNITRNINPKVYPRLYDWAKHLTRVVLTAEAKEALNHLGCIATLSIFAHQQSRKE